MSDRICLGKITGAHGIRGEVKIKSFTENARAIDAYGPLENKDGSQTFVLKVTGRIKDDLRAKIKGCDDRNMAEALRGTELYVHRDALPELSQEEFYHTDLIGLDVKALPNLKVIGKVAAMYNFGANDIVEIKLNGSNKLEMLPFTKEYVPEIKINEGYIIVQEMTFASEEEVENEG